MHFTWHALQLLIKIKKTCNELELQLLNLDKITCTWIEPVLCYHDPVLLRFGFDNHGANVLSSFLEVLVGVIEDPRFCEHMGQQPLFTEKSKAQNYSLHIIGEEEQVDSLFYQ